MTSRMHVAAAFGAVAAIAAFSVVGYAMADTGTDAADASDARVGATVTTSTITQAQYADGTRGLSGCVSRDGIRFCQAVMIHDEPRATWDVYLDLGQTEDLAAGRMRAESVNVPDEGAVPALAAAGPYVKIHWSDQRFDIANHESTLYTELTIGGTHYTYRCDLNGDPSVGGADSQVCSVTSS